MIPRALLIMLPGLPRAGCLTAGLSWLQNLHTAEGFSFWGRSDRNPGGGLVPQTHAPSPRRGSTRPGPGRQPESQFFLQGCKESSLQRGLHKVFICMRSDEARNALTSGASVPAAAASQHPGPLEIPFRRGSRGSTRVCMRSVHWRTDRLDVTASPPCSQCRRQFLYRARRGRCPASCPTA